MYRLRLFGETFLSLHKPAWMELHPDDGAPSIELRFDGASQDPFGELGLGAWKKYSPVPVPDAEFAAYSRSGGIGHPREWLLAFSGSDDRCASFHYVPERRCLRVLWSPGADEADVVAFAFGTVLAWIGRISGKGLCLHASGIVREERALLICGDSGDGKSTLAYSLVGRGSDFLCDDAAIVEPEGPSYRVHPGAPRYLLQTNGTPTGAPPASLWKGKHEISPTRVQPAGHAVPVAAIVFLGVRGAHDTGLAALDPPEAMHAICRGVFPRGVGNPSELAAREFAAAAKLVENIACYRLERPDDLDGLPAQCSMLEDLLLRRPAIADEPR